jgi:hypothetical protein
LTLGLDGWVPTTLPRQKWVVASNDPVKTLFVGSATESDSDTYIGTFSYLEPYMTWHWTTHAYYSNLKIPITHVAGEGAPTQPPPDEDFWITTAFTSGSTPTVLKFNPVWESNLGRHMLVVMNADGSSEAQASLQLGFKVPILGWLPYLFIPQGALLCFGGVFLIWRRKTVS